MSVLVYKAQFYDDKKREDTEAKYCRNSFDIGNRVLYINLIQNLVNYVLNQANIRI